MRVERAEKLQGPRFKLQGRINFQRMQPKVEIGEAREGELGVLGEIERACARLFPEEVLPVERRDDVVPAEVLRRAREAGTLWVARAAGEVVGYLVAEPTAEEIYVVQLDVRPDWQRRGVGRALVERAARCAEERGRKAVTLTTFASVPWNAPWYRKIGFVEVAEAALTERLRRQLEEERAAGLKGRVAMARGGQGSDQAESRARRSA